MTLFPGVRCAYPGYMLARWSRYRRKRFAGAPYCFTLVALIERPAIARVIIEPTTGTTPVTDALHYFAPQT